MFPPRTRPARILELEVGGSARLECFADGNPEPAFQWWHTAEEGGDEEEKTDADEVGVERATSKINLIISYTRNFSPLDAFKDFFR